MPAATCCFWHAGLGTLPVSCCMHVDRSGLRRRKSGDLYHLSMLSKTQLFLLQHHCALAFASCLTPAGCSLPDKLCYKLSSIKLSSIKLIVTHCCGGRGRESRLSCGSRLPFQSRHVSIAIQYWSPELRVGRVHRWFWKSRTGRAWRFWPRRHSTRTTPQNLTTVEKQVEDGALR